MINGNFFPIKKQKIRGERPKTKSRPAWYWPSLLVLIALVGFVAFSATLDAIGNIARRQNPSMALKFVPDEPVALSFKADQLFASSRSSEDLKQVEKWAKQSLVIYPLNATALRLMGWLADVRGDKNQAKNLVLLAAKVSRRELGAQLWLIEDAAAAGDNRRALHHYNAALSTTQSSKAVLFPTLVDALPDPDVRRELAPYIRQAPEWLPGFLNEAVSNASNPANVADTLLLAGQLPNTPTYQGLSNRLLTELAVKSKFVAFRQYYLSLLNTSSITLQSAALNQRTVNLPYPVAAWQVTDNPAIGGVFSEDSGRYTLSAFAGSGQRGGLIQKYIFLNPGRYRFKAKYRILTGAPGSAVDWDIRCLGTKNESKVLVSDARPERQNSEVVSDFTIALGCPAQRITIIVAGGNNQTGTEFMLTSVGIDRL